MSLGDDAGASSQPLFDIFPRHRLWLARIVATMLCHSMRVHVCVCVRVFDLFCLFTAPVRFALATGRCISPSAFRCFSRIAREAALGRGAGTAAGGAPAPALANAPDRPAKQLKLEDPDEDGGAAAEREAGAHACDEPAAHDCSHMVFKIAHKRPSGLKRLLGKTCLARVV